MPVVSMSWRSKPDQSGGFIPRSSACAAHVARGSPSPHRPADLRWPRVAAFPILGCLQLLQVADSHLSDRSQGCGQRCLARTPLPAAMENPPTSCVIGTAGRSVPLLWQLFSALNGRTRNWLRLIGE
jgi:hypothetical protein